MSYRIVKFPISIKKTSDDENIKKFNELLTLSTNFWNHLVTISNFHYNKINKTFHYENNTLIKHHDFKENKIPTKNQAEKLAKDFFKTNNIHSHLQQEIASRFANAATKSFNDYKRNPKLGLRFPKLKENSNDYKSLKFKQYNVGYKIDYNKNQVYFNVNSNKIKFNFIADDYHKNIIKNNKEKFILIKKISEDNYFLCVYIEGDFRFITKQNPLNIQNIKHKNQSNYIKKNYKKLNQFEKDHVDNIRKINKRKSKIITKQEDVKKQNLKSFVHPEKQIGIDPGCGYKNTLTLSNGIVYNFENNYYAKITRLEYNKEKLQRKVKDSKSYIKLQKTIKKQENNITNRRLDWLHKVAKHLVLNYDTISMEDFNSKSFVEENEIKFLNKQVMNGAFGTLKTLIAYKVKMLDKKFSLVNPEYTSQICSNCHKVVKKELSDRVHKCQCGLCINRDLNSAINILLLTTDTEFKNKFNNVVNEIKNKKEETRNGLSNVSAIALNKLSRLEIKTSIPRCSKNLNLE